jgi:hypothetical protein
MKLTKGVLHHIGCLQNHLVQQGVVTPGRRGNRHVIDRVSGSAGLGLNPGALLVQCLGGDDYLIERHIHRFGGCGRRFGGR